MLMRLGTPYDESAHERDTTHMRMRQVVLQILDSLTWINGYGQFLVHNCKNDMQVFSDNLEKAKQWLDLRYQSAKKKNGQETGKFELDKEITDDLTCIMHLLGQIMSDKLDKGQIDSGEENQEYQIVASFFMNQKDQYFQKLLANFFESFLALKSVSTVKDCALLRLVGAFANCFSMMLSYPTLIKLCKQQAMYFLFAFLSDSDLVEKCQIDLSSSANSEETDPDTDDELQQIESESEPLRLEIIKLLSLVFTAETDENQTAQESSIKLMIAQKSVPLVIKEMS